MREYVSIRTELERRGGFTPVVVDAIIYYHVDRQYGSDADGNRGEARVVIDDIVDVEARMHRGRTAVSLTENDLERVLPQLQEQFLEEVGRG